MQSSEVEMIKPALQAAQEMPELPKLSHPGYTVARVGAVVFLLLAASGEMGYEFYKLLRFVVFGAALACGFQALRTAKGEWGRTLWTVAFGLIAILFNPFDKFDLDRETWVPIDLLSAVAFAVPGLKSFGVTGLKRALRNVGVFCKNKSGVAVLLVMLAWFGWIISQAESPLKEVGIMMLMMSLFGAGLLVVFIRQQKSDQ